MRLMIKLSALRKAQEAVADDGDNRLAGTREADTIEALDGNDLAWGAPGDDLLDGGAGNDQIAGGLGNDTLIGGTGDDTLGGMRGDDELTGGAGADVFAFTLGSTTVTDFEDGVDVICLPVPSDKDNFDEMLETAVQDGENVVLTLGERTMTLENVTLDQIDAEDFVFAGA